jgi:hypothetical protein
MKIYLLKNKYNLRNKNYTSEDHAAFKKIGNDYDK